VAKIAVEVLEQELAEQDGHATMIFAHRLMRSSHKVLANLLSHVPVSFVLMEYVWKEDL
jgi:hypothetical protein